MNTNAGADHGEEEVVSDEGEQTTIQEVYEQHLRENERRLQEAERMAKLADVSDDETDRKILGARARVQMDQQQVRLKRFERATQCR